MIVNQPGLTALEYRTGTRDGILAAMKTRLSSSKYPAASALTTRQPDDATIALLDAWATTQDVLTFYQERIANECYLRTATERRSVVELAGLVGYRVRPGVAATVHLAYQLDIGTPPVVIPAGARSNSVPAPGENQQAFETIEDLEARVEWNQLDARTTRTQTPQSLLANGLYLKGTATRLAPNDALLLDFADNKELRHARVGAVEIQAQYNRTFVTVLSWDGTELKDLDTPREIPDTFRGNLLREKGDSFLDLLAGLRESPSIPPASSRGLDRTVAATFGRGQDIFPKLLTALQPRVAPGLYAAMRGQEVLPASGFTVYALRQKVSLFGHNAPREVVFVNGTVAPSHEWALARDQLENRLFANTTDDAVCQDRQIIIERPIGGDLANMSVVVADVEKSVGLSRSVYGLTGVQTMIETKKPWWEPDFTPRDSDAVLDAGLDRMETLRATTIYCRQEELDLAEEPIRADVGADQIELGALYDGLVSGRWIIVKGERTDIAGTTGVRAAELAMVSGVRQGTATYTVSLPEGVDEVWPRPGETTHTFLSLAKPLAYRYRRDAVTIHGNVVSATHGESRAEVLGSGVTGRTLQTFALKQPPLTHVPAATPEGGRSTLEVRVDEVQWHEADTLSAIGPGERGFISATDATGSTRVIFGTGVQGSRLPSGQENVSARYRSGIGSSGNVLPDQISQLATRPLGVKGVINPIRSSGGADAEGIDAARENAPLALMAFDRLVSVDDYANFSRRFAGVGKASAARLSNGRQRVMQVSIAGAEDAPIETTSGLYRNLLTALHDFGDPHLAVRVAVRELLAVVISAKVKVLPDFDWEFVEPHVRAALLDAFSFQHARLGVSIATSRVVQVIAEVRGVDWVDLDSFSSLSEQEVAESIASLPEPPVPEAAPELVRRLGVLGDRSDGQRLLPAQLACLLPGVADTLILSEVPS